MDRESASVCAIIVSFHPDHTLLASIHVILPQVTAVVVVDNGSAAEELIEVEHLTNRHESLTLLKLDQNFGLAYAQNKGIEWALAHDFQFVLILDQDSLPAEDMVPTLLTASQQLTEAGHKVSVVGPQALDQQSGRPFFFVRYGVFTNQRLFCPMNQKHCILPVDFLIASGSLIAAKVLATVGLMNEAFFIDQIDTEWCLRANFLGYQAFGVCEAKMHHRLGDAVIPVSLGKRKWYIATHSPLRDYYLFRNTVWMCFQKHTHWRWIFINLRRLVIFFFFFAFFMPPRRQRIKQMLKGLWDGLTS